MKALQKSANDVEDNPWVQRARAGDTAAYGELVRRHQEKVYMLALQMTRNHADADEVSQEAFVRGYQALDGFRADAQFFTWIYRITVNLCLTHLKNQTRSVPLQDSRTGDASEPRELRSNENPGGPMEEDETRRQVWHALEALSPELRAATVLVYLQDLSPREAARSLGCAEATVHWRLFKARKVLKRRLS